MKKQKRKICWEGFCSGLSAGLNRDECCINFFSVFAWTTTTPDVHEDSTSTSGAMKAIVPSNCPWNSPAPVVRDASLAAAPKSPIRNLWPVLSARRLAPETKQLFVIYKLRLSGMDGYLLSHPHLADDPSNWTNNAMYSSNFSSLKEQFIVQLTFPECFCR